MVLTLLDSGRSGTGTGGGGGDPNFANVVLLWEAEGTNGQTTGLVDVTGKTITVSGTAALSTTQARLGSTSLAMGTGGVNLADSADWDISATNTTPFTIEFSAYQTTMQQWETMRHWDTTKSWWIRLQADGQIRFLASSDGSTTFSMDVTTTGFGATNATWADICIEKDVTGKIRFYRGGVMKYSVTPANSAFFAAAGLLTMEPNAGNGWLDHIRITKGVARYGSDSGYTFTASPFPAS